MKTTKRRPEMAKRNGALPSDVNLIQDAMARHGIDIKRLSEITEVAMFNISTWFRNGIWAGGEITFRKLLAAGVITEVEYEELLIAAGYEPSFLPPEFRRQHPDICLILDALEDERLPEDFRHTIDGDLYDVVNKIRSFKRKFLESSITE